LNDVERSISRVKLDPGAEIITPVDRGGEGEEEVWCVEDGRDDEGDMIDVGVD
jgi:hypothetical protein